MTSERTSKSNVKIVQKYPPNYKAICKAIPGVKDNPNIIFTYGDTVYSPSTDDLPDHLRQHEATHVSQQTQMGKDEWWDEYLKNPEFRLKQELQAYRAQYKVVVKKRDWRYTEAILKAISTDLSGAMYGNILTYPEARKMITR